MREDYRTKGRRYVGEGRLTLKLVTADTIAATCKGNGEVYELGHTAGRWWCSCAARSTCSHLAALQLVTVRE